MNVIKNRITINGNPDRQCHSWIRGTDPNFGFSKDIVPRMMDPY